MKIPIIVLAAGASRRMGQPKALLPFEGRTCLSIVLSACRASRASGTILVLGAEADSIRRALMDGAGSAGTAAVDPDAIRVTVNERHARGQTSSFKAGLEQLAGGVDAFIVLPVDHPLVTASDIDELIARFEPRPRGRTIFIAAYEGTRGHPVLFSAGHRGAILEMGDDEPLHNYVRLREGECETVECDGPGVVMPMNTPEEYERVLSAYRARVAAG